MNILIDIAHPAHIHYFRNFYNEMTKNGHLCLMTLRNKEIIIDLANAYNINYRIRSNPHNKNTGKINYAFNSLINILKISKEFKPDIYLDMGTIFASPIAKLRGKPYIAFDDTEVSIKARLLHMPFTDYILTPSSFKLDLGKKQIRFKSYMELGYLHPNYYLPDDSVFKLLNIRKTEKYAIVRFVSWEAHHDVGQSGISLETKRKLIYYLKNKMKVFISSEGELPDDLKEYQINLPIDRIHDALNYSSLFITEGATMASEAALLGVPVIYYNSILNGYTEELCNYGLIYKPPNEEMLLKMIEEFSQNEQLKNFHLKLRENILIDKFDFTAFLVWFIQNYPESVITLKDNPNFTERFK